MGCRPPRLSTDERRERDWRAVYKCRHTDQGGAGPRGSYLSRRAPQEIDDIVKRGKARRWSELLSTAPGQRPARGADAQPGSATERVDVTICRSADERDARPLVLESEPLPLPVRRG